MEKTISQEETYSTKMTKKSNLEFASLWNKTNVKIASELEKTINAEKKNLPTTKVNTVKKQH